jgi:hypothetical protein
MGFECVFEKTFCPALRSTSSCPYSPNRQCLRICKPSFCPSPSTLPVFGPSGTSTLLLRETCRLQILLRIHILFKKKYFHFHTFIPQSRYIYFLLAFPLSPLGLSGTFAVGLFFSFFLYVVRRGSGVLSPATHAHPLSSPFSGRHNTNTTTHNIHGRPIRPGIRTLLTSWWSGSFL